MNPNETEQVKHTPGPSEAFTARQQLMYDMYPHWVAAAGWAPLDADAAEWKRRGFALAQGAQPSPTVAAFVVDRIAVSRTDVLEALRDAERRLESIAALTADLDPYIHQLADVGLIKRAIAKATGAETPQSERGVSR